MAVNSLKVCFGGEIRRIRVIPSDVSHLRALLEERFNLPSNYSITYKDDENETITIQTDEELSEAIQITAEDDRKTLRVEVISNDSSSDERSQGSNFETPSLNTAFQSLITAAATTALQAAIGIPNQDPSQLSSTSPHSQDAPQVVSNVEECSQMEDEIMTHRGVVCDICGMKPILGIRYKCSVRDDFDVCESCEAADVACPYPYLKIRHPSQAPACLITVLKDENNEEGEEEAAAARNLEQKLRNKTATFGDLRRGGRAWLKEQQQRRCVHGRGRRGRQHGNRPWCGRRMARNFAEQGQRNPEPGNTAATESKLSSSELQHEEDIKVAIQRSLEPSIKENTHLPVAEPMQAFDPPVPIEDVPPPQYATLSRQSTQEPTDALLPPTRKKTEKVQKPMARFVADVTIPDGTEILPGTTFVKIWKMRNDGEVTFPSETKLKNVGGDLMEGPEHVMVESIVPDGEFQVSLELTAPQRPGRYIGYWRLQTGEGVNFGHRLWVDIRVTEENQVFSNSTLDWALVNASGSIIAGDDKNTASKESNEDEDVSPKTSGDGQQMKLTSPCREATEEAEDNETVELPKDGETESSMASVKQETVAEPENKEAPSAEGFESPAEAEAEAEGHGWTEELAMLATMGFYDEKKIVPLLEKHCSSDAFEPASLERVIEELLG